MELKKKVIDFLSGRLEKAVYQVSKDSRQNALEDLKTELFDNLKEEVEIKTWGDGIFEEEVDKIVHQGILEKDKRPDSRKLDEVRPLYAETGLFKEPHGSALFVEAKPSPLLLQLWPRRSGTISGNNGIFRQKTFHASL